MNLQGHSVSRGRIKLPMRLLFLVLTIPVISGVGPATQASHKVQPEQFQNAPIPAAEFSHIISELSEDDGFFRSDNFISNETSYLHVVDKLHELGCSAGAYIGVGPEQNLTYIAKIRPQIAFIVDIRRQAIIQHLMYKALFHLSKNRAEFLSYLFSKPLAGDNVPGADASVQQLVDYFSSAPTDAKAFGGNLSLIERAIEEQFRFALSDHDRESLEYVYTAFKDENLEIQYRSGGASYPRTPWGDFPPLKEILLEQDLNGRYGNFLASREDYAFVRDLQERNRIIPIVGDFSGTKALAGVADYLKRNGYTVTAFYTSNVEQYLFANGVFRGFVENVKKLPINDRSVFIRAFPNMYEPHPASITGHRLTTLLQKIPIFLKDFDQGLYRDYWELVTTHYISADEPLVVKR